MTTYDHVHGYVRVRFPRLAVLALICGRLGMPIGWYVQSGDLPHDPECTPTEGVLRSEP